VRAHTVPSECDLDPRRDVGSWLVRMIGRRWGSPLTARPVGLMAPSTLSHVTTNTAPRCPIASHRFNAG
jgi:hypothetical protein